MFSGIVEEAGEVIELKKESSPYRLIIKTSLDITDTNLGDSICVQGVCLTVVAKIVAPPGGMLSFDVVPETLRRSTLGSLQVGDSVNLERSLKLGARLHGHFVFGHVDGTARLVSKLKEGKDSVKLTFRYPPELRKFLAKKGSIAISGVSLTLGEVGAESFSVYLVPHTLNVTTLSSLQIGGKVNVEIDMLARYAAERQEMTEDKGAHA